MRYTEPTHAASKELGLDAGKPETLRTTCRDDIAELARDLHQAVLRLGEVRRLNAVARWRGNGDRYPE